MKAKFERTKRTQRPTLGLKNMLTATERLENLKKAFAENDIPWPKFPLSKQPKK